MAEVAGQGKDPHARIGALQLAQEVQRGIAAAVVDVDEFEVEIGDGFQGGGEAAMGLADGCLLVETGDDDGQERAGAASVGAGGRSRIQLEGSGSVITSPPTTIVMTSS